MVPRAVHRLVLAPTGRRGEQIAPAARAAASGDSRTVAKAKGSRLEGVAGAIAPAAQELASLKDCIMLAMIGKIAAFQLPAAFPSGAVMKIA